MRAEGEPERVAAPTTIGATGYKGTRGAQPPTGGELPPPGRLRRMWLGGHRWEAAELARLEELLQERRRTSSAVAAGFEIQELDANVGGGLLAGAIAFRMFLFLVPFVYIVFTVLGLSARLTNEDPATLAKTFGITGVLAAAVVDTQDWSVWTQLVVLVGAAFALFLTAGSLTKALFVVHWLVWRIAQVKPTGLLPRLTVIAVTLLAAALATALNSLRNHTGAAGAFLALLLVFAASFAIWWWMSLKLPHADAPPRALIPGALFIAVGMEVMHLLTTYWLGHLVARKSHSYGAVGIALAVLLWVYILGRIIVGSAGLNATLWRRHQAHTDTAKDTAPDSSAAPTHSSGTENPADGPPVR
jgi:membrane protein